MKKFYLILIVAIFILLGFVLFNRDRKDIVQNKTTQPLPNQVQNNQEEQEKSKYETKKNEEGEVTVEVTPLNLSTSSDTKFSVVLNTHTVNINKDLKDVSFLTDDKGKEYKAKSWDGGVGGHHIEGTLIFPPLEKGSGSVQLKIQEIGGVERIFEWRSIDINK